MEEVWLTVEGTRVHGRAWSTKRARAGVVLLHGFNASVDEFGGLGETLAKAGFLTLAIDQRGHGASDGERGRFSLDRAMQDVEAAVVWLRKDLGRHAPLVLVGHSLGGAMALGIAARTRWFDALVVAHPLERLMDELNPVMRGVFHAAGRIGRWRMHRGKPAGTVPRPTRWRQLYVDPEAARQGRRDAYLQQRANLASYTFADTMNASEWARQVRVPVLAIQSAADRTVDPAHTETVLRAIPGTVERITHRGGHACFRDLDRDLVAEGIIRFLRQVAP